MSGCGVQRSFMTHKSSSDGFGASHSRSSEETRMWANAQRDAEYSWRPLFNAAKFGWRPLLECRTVNEAKTRNPLKFD